MYVATVCTPQPHSHSRIKAPPSTMNLFENRSRKRGCGPSARGLASYFVRAAILSTRIEQGARDLLIRSERGEVVQTVHLPSNAGSRPA